MEWFRPLAAGLLALLIVSGGALVVVHLRRKARRPLWAKPRPWPSAWGMVEALGLPLALAIAPQASLPLLVLVVLYHFAQQTEPARLGLALGRSATHLSAAYLVWLTTTPLIFAVNYAVTRYHTDWLGLPRVVHPLLQRVSESNDPSVWGEFLLSVLLVAPLIEELIFRGAVQGWATSRLLGGPVVLAVCAVVNALLPGPERWMRTIFLLGALLAALPYAQLVVRLRLAADVPRALGIYAASLLFAIFHASTWPDPVPLLLLGLALGHLTDRTRSLLAPILMHSLFNSVSAFLALLGWA